MNLLVVQDLEQDKKHNLGLSLLAGRQGLSRTITHSQVQKMGLALTGFIQFINPQRLQIIGNTDMAYFQTLPPDRQGDVIRRICEPELACLVVTRNLDIPEILLQEAENKGI